MLKNRQQKKNEVFQKFHLFILIISDWSVVKQINLYLYEKVSSSYNFIKYKVNTVIYTAILSGNNIVFMNVKLNSEVLEMYSFLAIEKSLFEIEKLKLFELFKVIEEISFIDTYTFFSYLFLPYLEIY